MQLVVKWDKDCIVHCALVAMIVQWDKDFRTSYENAPANYLSDERPHVFVHKVFVVFCSIIQYMCLWYL